MKKSFVWIAAADDHFELLAGKVEECSPGGVGFQLNRLEFRGALSEAVYRRLKARNPADPWAAE
ncbi:MAG: hypothetical protein ACR2FJ_09275 [Qipengyuania sp.]